jgi:hypothetical protein
MQPSEKQIPFAPCFQIFHSPSEWCRRNGLTVFVLSARQRHEKLDGAKPSKTKNACGFGRGLGGNSPNKRRIMLALCLACRVLTATKNRQFGLRLRRACFAIDGSVAEKKALDFTAQIIFADTEKNYLCGLCRLGGFIGATST